MSSFPQLFLERSVGSSTYIAIDLTDFLASGETISNATWTPHDPTMTTLVGGTPAMDNTLHQISAKFNYLTAGAARIEVVVTTATPTETHVIWVLVQQHDPPVV